MQNKKGQAAMEFLMTYGWAILAAIVVIAVLAIYFRPSTIVAGSSIVSAPFFANAQSIDTDGIRLEVKNNGGEAYTVTNFDITVNSPSGVSCTANTTSVSVGAGGTPTLSLGCSGLTSGDTISGDIAIEYTKSGSSLALRSTGSIADKVQ